MRAPPPLRSLWPRRAPALPPGQRSLATFPRFGDKPLRRPPAAAAAAAGLDLSGDALAPITLPKAELAALGARDQTSDFHCVTTWSCRQLRWGGVPMATVWERLIAPRLTGQPAYVVAVGADGHRAVFVLADLLAPEVLLATSLDGEPLDARHGAPRRLVSPAQYGYKSVKHLCAFELHDRQPASSLGAKEHLRARVALEERHERIPGRLLRWPNRILVPVAIVLAERSAAAE